MKFKLLILAIISAGLSFAQQPIQVLQWGGANTLGAPSNYGTSPGTVSVIGVNSFVTNTVSMNLTQVAGNALGTTSNYGTSPGAVAVMGVNAFVTNAASIGTPVPSSSSTVAFTQYHNSSGAAGNIKASAGNLYGMILGNSGTVNCWLQLFNNAGTPTAGTSVVDSIMVQAGVTIVVPANTLAYKNFTTGIAYAGATADSGATTTGCTTSFSVSAYYN